MVMLPFPEGLPEISSCGPFWKALQDPARLHLLRYHGIPLALSQINDPPTFREDLSGLGPEKGAQIPSP